MMDGKVKIWHGNQEMWVTPEEAARHNAAQQALADAQWGKTPTTPDTQAPPSTRTMSLDEVRQLVFSGKYTALLQPRHPEPFIRAVLDEVNDPLWGLHLRPVGRHGEGVIAWNVPGSGKPYQIFDIVAGAMGDAPAPSWQDQTSTMEDGSTFDPVVSEGDLPRVLTSGTRFVLANGAPFTWAGATAFDLPVRIWSGDFAFADWLQRTGFTLARIVPASKYRVDRTLAQGVRDLPLALQALLDRGLYAEVVVGVDTAVYGMTKHDMLAYARDIAAICRSFRNTLIEGANENSHGVQADYLRDRDFLDELVAVFAGVTCSAGSTHGGEFVEWTQGQYLTHHADRGASPEDNASYMSTVQTRYNKPLVDDEALGTDESHQPGRRTNDPAYGERQALAAKRFGLAGVTFHFEAGLFADTSKLGPVQDEAARRFVAAMK